MSAVKCAWCHIIVGDPNTAVIKDGICIPCKKRLFPNFAALVFVLLLPLLIGCESLKRLPGLDSPHSTPAENQVNPNDFYVTGTTTKDHESVYLNISSRTITVEILRRNETKWVTLERVDPPFNPYQLFTIPKQGVHFGDKAEKDSSGGLHLWTGTPAAPTGTQYRVHSVAKP